MKFISFALFCLLACLISSFIESRTISLKKRKDPNSDVNDSEENKDKKSVRRHRRPQSILNMERSGKHLRIHKRHQNKNETHLTEEEDDIDFE